MTTANPAAFLLVDHDEMTAAEQEAVTRYEHAIAGIPDCFDAMDGFDGADDESDRAYLAACPGMLRDWWSALDTLDGEGFPDCGKCESRAFALRFAGEVGQWFAARRGLLLAIARFHGYDPIPVPDHHGGEIETSNRPIGHYGFQHLTGLA